jgi:hypothetical protein
MFRSRTQVCSRAGRRPWAAIAAGLATLWLAAPCLAATITINFDVDPLGDPIAHGDIIDDTYAAYGVTFSRTAVDGNCNGTNVYANSIDSFASAPNNVSICDGDANGPSFNEGSALVEGVLEQPAVEICIAVMPEGRGDFGVLQIVDDMGVELDSVTSAPGVRQTLCIQGESIERFRFAGNDGRFATFDDLRITLGPNRIDFDTTADGTPIADGTIIDSLFVSEGVAFEKVGPSSSCGGRSIYANNDLPGTFGSPPNAVSVCNNNFSDFSEDLHGLVRAIFPRRVNQVCVDALPSGAEDQAVLRGYNGLGNLVAFEVSAAGNVETRVCINEPTMRYVEFAGRNGGLARFDNLDFTFGAAAIDFDFDTQAQPIPSGTVVNATYQPAGVLLEGERVGVSCGDGDSVYANGDVVGDFASSPNQVSLCNTQFSDFSENAQGMVSASFVLDALSVCVDVRASQSNDFAVLRSFNVNDDFLDEVTSSPGATETVCISGDAIRRVRFAGDGSRFARFDDLEVTFAPEPSGALLGAFALVVISATARRRAPRRT